MADETLQVQSLGKRFWNAVFGSSPAPGSGADRSTHGKVPIRVSSKLVQKKRQIGNHTFRVPGPHRPRVPYDRALIIRAGKLDQNFATGRIWFAEELNRERGISVHEEGGYRLVDYDDQGQEVAIQDVPTALLGQPQDDKNQGPRTLQNMRLVSASADQLPIYHFWKRDDEVEPVGRIIEKPRVPMEAPRKRDDRPQWKITADAVDHAFAMDRCRTYKPPTFEERGERIPNFDIAANPKHREKFRVKRQEMLRLFKGQKKELLEIVNDTFDPVQKQLLLPALYINAVRERQEQDKVKYAEAIGENGAYRDYRDNAITKMTMLWFGQPIAPLRYMEVIHDYTKDPDAIPGPESNLPRFEQVTESEAPLEFLDLFNERSYGYPMLRLNKPSPEELEKRVQLLKESKTSSLAGPGKASKQNSDKAPDHPAGEEKSSSAPSKYPVINKPLLDVIEEAQRILAQPAIGGGVLQSVRGEGKGKGAGRGQIPSDQTPAVVGPSLSTASTDRGSKAAILTKSAPTVSESAPVKFGATFQQLGGGYVPSLRGGGQSDDEMSELLRYYEADEGETGHRTRSRTSKIKNEDRAKSTQSSSSQDPASQNRITRARSAQAQTTQTQTETKSTSAPSSQNQSGSTHGVGTLTTKVTQTPQHVWTAVQIWGPKMELIFKMSWVEIRSRKDFVRMVMIHTRRRIKNIDGVRFAMDTEYPKPSPVFTALDVLTDADVPNSKQSPKVLWVIPYWNTIKISDVTPSQDIANPDQSTRPGVVINWSQEKNLTSLRECLKELYGKDWDDHEEVIVNYLNQENIPGQLILTDFTLQSDFWFMMNGLVNPELFIKRPGALDPNYRPSKPAPISRPEVESTTRAPVRPAPISRPHVESTTRAPVGSAPISRPHVESTTRAPVGPAPISRPHVESTIRAPVGPAPISRPHVESTTRAPVGPAPNNNAPAPMEGVINTQSDPKAAPANQSPIPNDNTLTATTNNELNAASPNQETVHHSSFELEESEKSADPNIARYVEPRSKKRSRTEWEEWCVDQGKKDHKKHDEYTMERSIYSYDDPPIIPTSGRPLQQGITGGSSVATVYVRNVTATDQARLQRQRRKVENNYLDRIQACPICPSEFSPGPKHKHEVEAHWQWHRDRLMDDGACPICGDKEWVSFDLVLKRQHLRDHTRVDLETCPATNCNSNLRDPKAFSTVVEAAQHILGHNAPPETETISRLGKQQAILRHAIGLTGVPTLRDAHCKWIMPNGVWCGEDLNDMTKYSDWQYVCDHLFSHYTPKVARTTQSGDDNPVTKTSATAPHDTYICRMIVDNKQCTYVTRTFGNFYQHINVMHRAPLSCPLCQAPVTGEMNLLFHMSNAHPPQVAEHSCPAGAGGLNPCGRKFSSDQLFFEHVMAEHSADRPPVIKCHRGNGCLFQTQDSVAFDEHLRAHEGRALRCGECNYVSYNGDNLDGLREHLVGHATARAAAGIDKPNKPKVVTRKSTGPRKVPESEPQGSDAPPTDGPTVGSGAEGVDEENLEPDNPSAIQSDPSSSPTNREYPKRIEDLVSDDLPPNQSDSSSSPTNREYPKRIEDLESDDLPSSQSDSSKSPSNSTHPKRIEDLESDNSSPTKPNPVTPTNRTSHEHIELDDDNDTKYIDFSQDGTQYQAGEPVYLWCNHCWMKAVSASHTKRHMRTCGLKPEERKRKTTYLAGLLRARVDAKYASPRRPANFVVPEETPSQSTDSNADSRQSTDSNADSRQSTDSNTDSESSSYSGVSNA